MKRFGCVLMLLSLAFVGISTQAKDYVGGNFQLKAPLDDPKSYCFDLFGFGMGVETKEPISVHTCKNEGWKDATFTVDYPEQGQIYSPDYDMCAEVTRFERGAHLMLQPCSDSELQRFIYRENQTLELVNTSSNQAYCVVVHPADGIATGGPGHLRREVYVYGCDQVELEHAQWLLPEGKVGLAEPEGYAELRGANAPASPEIGFYMGACARCHGEHGEGIAEMHSPRLAGLSSWYITEQFYHFVNGVRGTNENERWASQMVNHVSEMPPRRAQMIVGAAEFLAGLPEVEVAHTLDGDTENGEAIYQANCAVCHAETGLGDAALKSPRLAGIDDWYLLRQMQKFSDGRRGAHEDDEFGAQMVPFAQALSEEETVNVIAYINTL